MTVAIIELEGGSFVTVRDPKLKVGYLYAEPGTGRRGPVVSVSE